MSFTSLLIDTCTTRRYTTGVPDAYGAPLKTWADRLEDQACRLMPGHASAGGIAGAGMDVITGAKVIIADYTLFIGDVDITEQDRVVIDGITYEVVIVASRQNGTAEHHKECGLKVVR